VRAPCGGERHRTGEERRHPPHGGNELRHGRVHHRHHHEHRGDDFGARPPAVGCQAAQTDRGGREGEKMQGHDSAVVVAMVVMTGVVVVTGVVVTGRPVPARDRLRRQCAAVDGGTFSVGFRSKKLYGLSVNLA
jgi:hypothetical protein